MRKIFSLLAAALIAASATYAGENLINPATMTLETWFGDANWQPETNSTGTYDPATGVASISIAEDKNGQWRAQVKFSTGVTALDVTKQYDFSAKMTSTVDINNVTVKVFDNAEMFMKSDVSLVANTANVVSAKNLAGLASNGVIVFDFGFATAGAEIKIEDIVIEESATLLHNCASIMNLQKNDEVTMGEFDVVYVSGSYIYIKDAKGSALLYQYNYGLKAGDHVAAGLQATIDIHNGLYEIKPTSPFADLTVTPGNAPVIPTASEAPANANMNAVVVYKNVTFAAGVTIDATNRNTTFSWKGQDIAMYNALKLTQTFEASKAYNITAANSVYTKDDNTTYQVNFLAVEEYVEQGTKDTVDHGLYNPDKASIPSTYFATGDGWTQGEASTAELVNGQIIIHIDAVKANRWQGQVFLNPGFEWVAGKAYKMEFDLETNNQLGGVDIKFNDSDENIWYQSYPNDNVFLANQDVHYVAEPINVASLEGGNGYIVFGIGWCPAGTDIRIHNIQIVETGSLEPVEESHMYIKHPWGTGLDADWSWQEMAAEKYEVYDAYVYEGLWGGVGCNINDKADDADATWYPADKIQFLTLEAIVVSAPAVGTEVKFVYVPALKDSEVVSPVKVIYDDNNAVENVWSDTKATKVMIDGQVYILRNGVRYNALGAQVK